MFIIKRIGFGILYVRVRYVCVYLLRVCTHVRKKKHVCVYVCVRTRMRGCFVCVCMCVRVCGWNEFCFQNSQRSGWNDDHLLKLLGGWYWARGVFLYEKNFSNCTI